jgi:alkylated DNA nucleotide flippase Atl1
MSSKYTTSEAEAVYDACASVPEGMVITYADLAQLVGRPTTHARTVSTILGHRPNEGTSLDPLPWWRVVRSDGSLLDAAQITGPAGSGSAGRSTGLPTRASR